MALNQNLQCHLNYKYLIMPNKPHLPPAKIRKHRTNIRWTKPEYKLINNLAKKQGLNVSKFIRQCVDKYIKIPL